MRRAQVLGLVALAGAAMTLTACEKPPPGVSVFSGPASVRSEALCWAFESDQLTPGECAQEILQGQPTGGIQNLSVTPGDTVGVSVDPVVAESGWTISIGGQKLIETPLTTTYFRFTLPDLPSQLGTEQLPMQIIAGQNTKIRGVWIVGLQPNAG
ncbi:MAG: hypothetical protein V9E98_02200 [Candidatus Nanopelagicales bacterium]